MPKISTHTKLTTHAYKSETKQQTNKPIVYSILTLNLDRVKLVAENVFP